MNTVGRGDRLLARIDQVPRRRTTTAAAFRVARHVRLFVRADLRALRTFGQLGNRRRSIQITLRYWRAFKSPQSCARSHLIAIVAVSAPPPQMSSSAILPRCSKKPSCQSSAQVIDPHDLYEKHVLIGRGSFGNVYKGRLLLLAAQSTFVQVSRSQRTKLSRSKLCAPMK